MLERGLVLMLTLRDDTHAHPDVQQLLPIVFRSLTKPNKIGFSRALMQGVRETNVLTRSGLFLGKRPVYDVDLDRLDRVAQRIVKGLFYYERGSRLPDGYEVAAFSAAGLSALDKQFKEHIIKNVVDPILLNIPRTIGNNVFTYRVAFAPEDPNLSVWHLIFYEKVVFLCFTTSSQTDGAA
jgi:hypothetical protein